MKYLIDTNIVSHLLSPAPAAVVVDWLNEHNPDCALSIVTLAEIRYGVERLPVGKRRRALEKKARFLAEDYADVILPFAEAEGYEWGRYCAQLEAVFGVKALEHFDVRDTYIAATALVHSLIVVTDNTKHFALVETLNPLQS